MPENGARIRLRSIVAWISPTRASACLCSALARSYSRLGDDLLIDEAPRAVEVEPRQIALGHGRGELRPLLTGVEPHQDLPLREPPGPIRT